VDGIYIREEFSLDELWNIPSILFTPYIREGFIWIEGLSRLEYETVVGVSHSAFGVRVSGLVFLDSQLAWIWPKVLLTRVSACTSWGRSIGDQNIEELARFGSNPEQEAPRQEFWNSAGPRSSTV